MVAVVVVDENDAMVGLTDFDPNIDDEKEDEAFVSARHCSASSSFSGDVVVGENEEEAGEAFMSVPHRSSSSSSYGDVVVGENEDEVELCNVDAEEVVRRRTERYGGWRE